MGTQEKKVFIGDPESNMEVEDRNEHLSAELSGAPYSKMSIIRIERTEEGASGWWIYYRGES